MSLTPKIKSFLLSKSATPLTIVDHLVVHNSISFSVSYQPEKTTFTSALHWKWVWPILRWIGHWRQPKKYHVITMFICSRRRSRWLWWNNECSPTSAAWRLVISLQGWRLGHCPPWGSEEGSIILLSVTWPNADRFLPLDAMLARYVLSSCVRPSVCHKPVVYQKV